MAAKNDVRLVDVIPDEILVLIFSKLPLRDLLLCVRQVCLRWFHLSKDESLWKEIDFNSLCFGSEHKDKDKNSEGVQKLLFEVEDIVEKVIFSNVSFNSNVYELFHSPKNINDHSSFTKLRSLDYSYSAVGVGCLRRALSVQPQLQELILVHTNVLYSEVMAEAIHLPFLKKIVFHDLHAWDNLLDHRQESRRMYNKRVTIQLSQNCCDLEWVELFTIWADLDNDVIQSFAKNCPKLARLLVTWSTNITPIAFFNATACSKITHLGLADRQEREPYLHFVLPHFSHLISLTVNGRDVHTEDCIALSNFCPKLQDLVFELKTMRDHDCLFDFYLHQHNSLSGENLKHIVEGCKELHKLHAPCSKVDDDSIIRLSSNCTHLEDINFMHCPLLSIQSLIVLTENSKNLKYANFQHTFDPQDHLQIFLNNCPLLQEINFDLSMSITDAMSVSYSPLHSPSNSACMCSSLSRLQDGCVHSGFSDELPFIDMFSSQDSFGESIIKRDSSLLEFSMENASLEDITNISYDPVAENHCHIKKISLRNTKIPDKVLQDIFHICPDLTHIVLDGCFDLTDMSVKALVKNCRNLKVLMMSAKLVNSSEVGDGSLINISKYCRHLEILSLLYNRNITNNGVFDIFRSLDTVLRKLRSFSFCVGSQYGCKMPLKPPYGVNYLTEQSLFCIGDIVSSEFRILHLEFKERRCVHYDVPLSII